MSREEGQAERSDAPQQSSALSPQEEAVVTPEATAERSRDEQLNKPETAKVSSSGAKEGSRGAFEGIDPAIADALKAPKNRQTVLRFEDDVLAFLQSDEEALLFPLSLSGYQRLLAHRTAQYHGLQTATVDDGGEDHGKIRATKPSSSLEAKSRLADVKVPEPAEEPREHPRAGRKKGGERQVRRDREASLDNFKARLNAQGSQDPDFPQVGERIPRSSFLAQELQLGGLSSAVSTAALSAFTAPGPGVHLSRPHGVAAGSMDTDYRQHTAFALQSQAQEAARAQLHGPAGSMRLPGRVDAAAAQMMSGLSLQQMEQQGIPLPGMPGYPPMQMPMAYVPGVGGVPQAVPNLQGMGMYGNPQMAYGGYGMPMPYPYFPGRPGQQQMMPQLLGQPMGPGLMPYYPGFVPQGYQMGAMPGLQLQPPHGGHLSRQGSMPSAAAQQQSSGLGHRRVSAPAFSPHARVDSGISSTSTQQHAAGSAGSNESISGEVSSSPGRP